MNNEVNEWFFGFKIDLQKTVNYGIVHERR